MNRKTEKFISFFINILTFGFVRGIIISTHHDMVEGDVDCKFLRRATFRDFRQEFEKREWVVIRPYMDSLFCPDEIDGYLHADIFRFGNVGFLMTTLGYIRARRLIRREVRKRIMKSTKLKIIKT